MEQTRSQKKIGIADHIWDAFEEMAQAMGSDRDALINQAMFMFARLNGYLDPQPNGRGGGTRPAAVPQRSSPSLPSARSRPDDKKLDDDPQRREVAERVLETAAELERLIKGKGEREAAADDEGNLNELDEQMGMDEGGGEVAPGPEEGGLYLMVDGGDLDKITKDRFVIGRGKHCDFVINSGKVSREHAVIIREGNDYFVEDLGSSNGTWFNKQRIKRRKIEDGDEYFICSEKVKFVVR